jgi:hypothetical protein
VLSASSVVSEVEIESVEIIVVIATDVVPSRVDVRFTVDVTTLTSKGLLNSVMVLVLVLVLVIVERGA